MMQTQEAAQDLQTAHSVTIQIAQSVRKQAEAICAEEGLTLDEFVKVAIADRIAHHAHLDWLKRRKVPTEASLEEVRRILRRPDSRPPDRGDELPEGYVRELL